MGWLFSGREADRKKKTQRRRWKRRTKVSETRKEWTGTAMRQRSSKKDGEKKKKEEIGK